MGDTAVTNGTMAISSVAKRRPAVPSPPIARRRCDGMPFRTWNSTSATVLISRITRHSQAMVSPTRRNTSTSCVDVRDPCLNESAQVRKPSLVQCQGAFIPSSGEDDPKRRLANDINVNGTPTTSSSAVRMPRSPRLRLGLFLITTDPSHQIRASLSRSLFLWPTVRWL